MGHEQSQHGERQVGHTCDRQEIGGGIGSSAMVGRGALTASSGYRFSLLRPWSPRWQPVDRRGRCAASSSLAASPLGSKPCDVFCLSDEPVADLAAYQAVGGGDGLRALAERGIEAGTRSSWRNPGCGAAAAPGSQPDSNGAPSWPGAPPPVNGSSSPTAQRGNRAPSRTVSSFGTTRSRCWRAWPSRQRSPVRLAPTSPLKSSFAVEIDRLSAALVETAAAGWWPDVEVSLVGGPEEYLFGEEKALLEVIEGEDPLPRQFPPYVYGLFTTSPTNGLVGRSEPRPPGSRDRIRRWSTTSRRWPTSPRSWLGARAWFRSIGTRRVARHPIVHDLGRHEPAWCRRVRNGNTGR